MVTRAKPFFVAIILQLIVLPFCSNLFARQSKWAEQEVRWIIARAEREEFKALASSEQREAFIERFWQRRDPTPGTPRNEFRDEYYRRLKFVKERFREGMPGWKTDRGRVYLIHGPPDQVESFGREGGDAYGVGHGSASLVWKYNQLSVPAALSGSVVFVFQPDQGSTRQLGASTAQGTLDRRSARPIFSRSGTKVDVPVNASVRYRLVAAGPPSILAGNEVQASPDSSMQIELLLRSPGEGLMEKVKELERQQASQEEMRQQIDSTVAFEAFPLSMALHEFYSSEEVTLNLAWRWPLSALQFQESEGIHSATADLMVQVRNAGGQTVDEFFKSFTLRYSRQEYEKIQQEFFEYFNEFHLPRGEDYRVTAVIKDTVSGSLGSSDKSFSALSPQQQVHLSALVLAKRVVPRNEMGPGQDLNVDEFQVVPEVEHTFTRQDKLILYCKIYQVAEGTEGPQLAVDYRFLRDGEVQGGSRPRLMTAYSDALSRAIRFSAVVDLNQLEAGEYRLQLTAVDLNSKKFAIGRTRLTVVDQ